LVKAGALCYAASSAEVDDMLGSVSFYQYCGFCGRIYFAYSGVKHKRQVGHFGSFVV
jgi:hypothetical protein